MAHERLNPKFVFDAQRIKQLMKIAPECFADGEIQWDVLQESLGSYLEGDFEKDEHFGLFWPGKKDSRRISSIPSQGTLIPVNKDGINPNSSNNIFIEGENLEVLKLLQKSYSGEIKLIYIDPPYNTGNDFVYDDNFTESIEDYLKRTGQLDEESNPLSANSKSDGRFHSKWLSMMYPRIRLARNLLKPEGVMFISIDDNEFHNLIHICNELFGEENHVGTLKWKRKKQPSFLHGHIASVMEYIVIYAKEKDELEKLSIEKRSDSNTRIDNATNRLSERIIKKGLRVKLETDLIKKGVYRNKTMQTEYLDDVKVKNGVTLNDVRVKAQFRNEQKELDRFVQENAMFITKNYGLRRDLLPEELEKRKAIVDLLLDWGDNQESDNEIKELYPEGKPFDYPKPTTLIKKIISSTFCENEIVLDFFAGSGTTGQAILDLNSTDFVGNNISFILVQLQEEMSDKTDGGRNAIKLGFERVHEITKDRLKRVNKKLKKEYPKVESDFGFKVFKLFSSNFKPWQNFEGTDINKLEELFSKHESPLIDGWKNENLFTEILLLEGFPLHSLVNEISEFKKNKLIQVTSDFCDHKLLVCLDEKVYADTIKSLHLNENDIFICLDTAINDEQKVILSDKGLIKTI